MVDLTEHGDTTKNFIEAMDAYLKEASIPKPKRIAKLIYDSDGNTLGMTEDDVPENTLHIVVDRKEIEEKYGSIPNIRLKVIDGKLQYQNDDDNGQRVGIVSGNKWQSDKEFRMITGDAADGDKDGWSKRDS